MSNVILFGERQGGRKASPLPEGHCADIVIFHGVRVERLTDDMIAATAEKTSRRIPIHTSAATAEELE
jgi:hypothetical protein